VSARRALTAPSAWVRERRLALDQAASQCQDRMGHWVLRLQDRLAQHLRLLASLDPERVLSRGYALVRDAAGKPLTSVSKLTAGAKVTLQLKDGRAAATIDGLAAPSSVPAQPRLL
jgi:exodeoxyribonuclease VII large subunit